MLFLFMISGVLQPLVNMLNQNDAKITMVVLDAMKNILQAGDKMNHKDALCEILEEMGLVDQLERLQTHQNVDVSWNRFVSFFFLFSSHLRISAKVSVFLLMLYLSFNVWH